MITRPDKYGHPISQLGFGCMRLPASKQESERLIVKAVELGVNYFDTAYVYPGSEATLGEILEKNGLRDQVNIATKLPHYLIKSRQGLEKLFQEELKRLRTDHVDYYLMHMLTDVKTWERLKALGIEDWLKEKKASGAIRQVGFYYHGGSDMFCQLVDAYDWEFCLIQYNYLDEHSQAGRRGLHYAHGKGLPVFIMEPLRGGKLVNQLPQEALKAFENHSVRRTPAQWAFNWLWDQQEVTCVLSGMNSMEMLMENCQAAAQAQPGMLTDEDQRMLRQVVDAINAKMKVGCTGCGYCLPCPKGVDIPGAFAAYNRRYTESKMNALREYMMCTALRKTSTAASLCVGCGKCEGHCPQQIPIRQELKNVQREMEGIPYKIVRKGVEWLKLY
ncbi:MAG: aldo/keto reductase [Clostridia bacterium]|nr:aldo/keto reductase [Clostridia bacterium]